MEIILIIIVFLLVVFCLSLLNKLGNLVIEHRELYENYST